MPKGTNVLKIILLLIFFNNQSETLAQNPEFSGKYSSLMEGQEFYELYELQNKEFSFTSGGDLGIHEYGSGDYVVQNDMIILNYNDTQLTPVRNESEILGYKNFKSDLHYRFLIKDFNGQIIENANIFLNNDRVPIEMIENYHELTIPKEKLSSNDRVELIITKLGFREFRTELFNNLNYIIKIKLSQDKIGSTPIYNAIDTLSFKKVNNHYILFKEEKIFKRIE